MSVEASPVAGRDRLLELGGEPLVLVRILADGGASGGGADREHRDERRRRARRPFETTDRALDEGERFGRVTAERLERLGVDDVAAVLVELEPRTIFVEALPEPCEGGGEVAARRRDDRLELDAVRGDRRLADLGGHRLGLGEGVPSGVAPAEHGEEEAVMREGARSSTRSSEPARKLERVEGALHEPERTVVLEAEARVLANGGRRAARRARDRAAAARAARDEASELGAGGVSERFGNGEDALDGHRFADLGEGPVERVPSPSRIGPGLVDPRDASEECRALRRTARERERRFRTRRGSPSRSPRRRCAYPTAT